MAVICVDPVLVSCGGNKSVSQTSSGSNSPQQATTSPIASPSKSATTSSNQSDRSPSKSPTDNLLKLAIAKSMTDKTPAEKVIQPLSVRLLISQRSRDARFKKTLQKRDKKCVISGTSWEHCKGSHVIPHSLVKVALSLFIYANSK